MPCMSTQDALAATSMTRMLPAWGPVHGCVGRGQHLGAWIIAVQHPMMHPVVVWVLVHACDSTRPAWGGSLCTAEL